MRSSLTRSALVLTAVAGVALSSTACVPGMFNGKKKAACSSIESELRSLANSSPSSSTTGLSLQASRFRLAASRIRIEGRKAGGDVESAAVRFSYDLDSVARTLSSPSTTRLRTSTLDLQRNARDLGNACDFTGSFSF